MPAFALPAAAQALTENAEPHSYESPHLMVVQRVIRFRLADVGPALTRTILQRAWGTSPVNCAVAAAATVPLLNASARLSVRSSLLQRAATSFRTGASPISGRQGRRQGVAFVARAAVGR